MRTTVTLDADTRALVEKDMRERGVSFKQALNDAVRAGLAERGPVEPFRTETARLGAPSVSLDRALQIAGELEDEELLRKMRSGK